MSTITYGALISHMHLHFGKILDCIKKHICGKGIIYLKRGINTQEKASNIFLKLLLLPTADLKLIYSLRPAVVVPSV